MNKKTISWIIIACLLFQTVAAFLPDEVLGDDRKIPGVDQFLTAAGQARGCDDYPHETGTFTNSKRVICPVEPALINIYECVSNDPLCQSGWQSVKELESGELFVGSFLGQNYAYECYACPEESVCEINTRRCTTNIEVSICRSSGWEAIDTCGSNQLCDPDSQRCVNTEKTCVEDWTCSSWGICSVDGQQKRFCVDQNRCGTFKNDPAPKRSCDPPVVQQEGEATIQFDTITASQFNLKVGESTLIKASVTASEAGDYMLEVGSGVIGFFTAAPILDIRENNCNPGETQFANNIVKLKEGTQEVTFEITPTGRGRHAFWVAWVSGCGGDVLERLNSVNNLLVDETAEENAAPTTGLFANFNFGMLVALLFLAAGIWHWKKK